MPQASCLMPHASSLKPHASSLTPIIGFSFPLILLLGITSLTGILIPGFYSQESFNWQVQSVGQDYVDLFLVTPLLILTVVLAFRKNKIAEILWGGISMYLLYTFLIYCFDIHFNRLFLLYCFILGLSFYSFIYFFYKEIVNPVVYEIKNNGLIKLIGIYFLIIPFIFYFLWLSEILPAIINRFIPKTLADSGLFTNPVHIIDLSVFLPGVFIAGILLLKKHKLGLLFAPVILIFFILMDITIGGLVVIMHSRGLDGNLSIAAVMGILAVFSGILLFRFLNEVKKTLS